jgi:hypothetical protein
MQNETNPTTTDGRTGSTVYPARRRVYSVNDIKAVMEAAGSHWWEPSTMRFFASRVPMGQPLYRLPGGLLAFVSSEKASFNDPTRRWSVRTWNPLAWVSRACDTPEALGGFVGHASRAWAVRAIREAGGVPLTDGVTLAEVTR